MVEQGQQIHFKQLLFKPHYDIEKGYLMNFITTYQNKYMESDETYGQNKYMIQLQRVANGQQRLIEILFEDLEEFFHGEQDEKFLNQIHNNTKRYIQLLCDVVDQVMPGRNMPLQEDEEIPNLEIQNQQRQNFLQQNENQSRANQNFQIPPALKRKYELVLINGPNSKQTMTPLRHLKASLIGSHVTIKCQILRCSEVSPMMQVATYICDACGYEIYQQINSRTFTPLVDCCSQICQTNRTRGKLIPTNQASKFIAYQEIMVQETQDLVPVGNIPRTFRVIAKGHLTYQCSPGDTCVIQGIFLPSENETFEGLKSLVNETHLEALRITREKKKYMDLFITNDIEQQLQKFINKYKANERYNILAQSIAPEIYGLENVKKALLLQMIGGQTKEMDDGLKIRGDIHIALIGDPGLAKSQLLKFIAQISPRGIYTTGKGNTGAGLTVAVLRDGLTNEVTLEGGALVLSDMGVCCIDEFDKMNDHDKTAIHEVMEQQTVSIAKAGITATLNTRTSVLAAANPSYGRYDRKLTPHANINLPAALLSRFDLIFLLLDTRDEINDNLLANHICYVHQTGKAPQHSTEALLDIHFIRAFISRAKMYAPILEPIVQKYMEEKYVELRKKQIDFQAGYVYSTPRTLLAVVRLAQAMARLRFSTEVDQTDVDEALRIMDESQASVLDSMNEKTDKKLRKEDTTSIIYQLIKNMCQYDKDKSASYEEIQKKTDIRGFKKEDLEQTVKKYQQIGVLMYSRESNTITLLN